MRFATGERFEAMIRPAAGLPREDELATIGLTRADFDDALPREQLAHALDAFLRPGDVGLAWNRSTPSLMHDATGIAHRMRLLKPVLRELGPLDEHGSLQSLDVLASLARTELGEADQALDTEGLRGRAARRLANLLRVAHATRLRGLKAPTLE
jgi:hypothetical protein